MDPKDVLFDIVDPAHLLIETTTADAALGGRIGPASIAGLPASS